MACAPCAAARAKLKEQAKSGDVVGAVKTTVAGVAAMTGVISKERLAATVETPDERAARKAREAHERWKQKA
ncbi:MAG: hypothetical protein WAS51_14465 [Ilumatobacteraceae bacterium]